jgi:hypothetical protein
MSNINYDSIDAAYPIAGQDNSSQGFRDNFAAIKTGLQVAADEISDLQNTVIRSTDEEISINGNVIYNGKSALNTSHTTYAAELIVGESLEIDLSTVHSVSVELPDAQGALNIVFANWARHLNELNGFPDSLATVRVIVENNGSASSGVTLSTKNVADAAGSIMYANWPGQGAELTVGAGEHQHIELVSTDGGSLVYARWLGTYEAIV